jgi:hypothetical protein
MMIRGGGHPKQTMVLTPVSRMGPPPRSFAADAHDCIMVRSLSTYRIQGCGAMIRARWQAPPLIVVPTASNGPSCSELSRCGLARPGVRGKAGGTANLDSSCARRLCNTAGRGEETGLQVEQRNWNEGSGECREISA